MARRRRRGLDSRQGSQGHRASWWPAVTTTTRAVQTSFGAMTLRRIDAPIRRSYNASTRMTGKDATMRRAAGTWSGAQGAVIRVGSRPVLAGTRGSSGRADATRTTTTMPTGTTTTTRAAVARLGAGLGTLTRAKPTRRDENERGRHSAGTPSSKETDADTTARGRPRTAASAPCAFQGWQSLGPCRRRSSARPSPNKPRR